MAASARTLNKAKLDSLFGRIEARSDAAGSIALYKGGDYYQRAFGYRYISPDQSILIPNDTETRINVGSITKTFVATMTFQLVDQGKLSLDDKLSKWYPEMPNADRITIRQMLGHRSGLENYMDNRLFQMTYTAVRTEAELLEVIRLGKPAFEPGEQEAYSNAGYVLLRKIIEQETGQSFAEALSTMICQPLGMEHTGIQPAKTDGSQENIAQSYLLGGDTWTPYPETHVSNLLGAGGITASPSDLIIFAKALFDGKLISETSLKEMRTIHPDRRFGLGLAQMPYNGHRGIGHTGGIDAFRAAWVYYPDEDILFAGCFNNMIVGRDRISHWTQAILFDEPLELPTFEKTTIDSAILDGYTGIFTSEELPLSLTITQRDGTLWCQGSGQNAFPLNTVDEKRFEQEQFSVRIEFKNNDELILTQGKEYHYTRKK